MGVRSIDLVVVTDPRASNVAGLLSLLEHYRLKAVLDVGAQYPARTYADWRQALETRHIPVYALRTGATARVGRVALTALAPDASCYAPSNCAGILRLSAEHRSILVATHAGKSEQENAVFGRPSLHAINLFLGDVANASPDFIRAAHAGHVWCATPRLPEHAGCTALMPGKSASWPM
jgi:beta-lactamase superfamily II metal-dependent hydrolase